MSDIEQIQFPFDAVVISGRDPKSTLPGVLVIMDGLDGPMNFPENLRGTRIINESLVPDETDKLSGTINRLGEVSICADNSSGMPVFGHNY